VLRRLGAVAGLCVTVRCRMNHARQQCRTRRFGLPSPFHAYRPSCCNNVPLPAHASNAANFEVQDSCQTRSSRSADSGLLVCLGGTLFELYRMILWASAESHRDSHPRRLGATRSSDQYRTVCQKTAASAGRSPDTDIRGRYFATSLQGFGEGSARGDSPAGCPMRVCRLPAMAVHP